MKNLIRRFQIGCLGVLMWGVSFSTGFAAPEIPFEAGYDHLIVVKGSVGKLQQLNFVVDTGATRTVVSHRITDRLKFKKTSKRVALAGNKGTLREVMIPEIRIGTVRFDSVPALLGPADLLPGYQIDALIGLDLLRQTNLHVDFVAKTITLGLKEHYESATPFYPKLNFVLVRLFVQERPLALELDTGAEDLVLFKRRVQGQLEEKRTGETKRMNHIGGQVRLQKVLLCNVQMGVTHWKERTAFFFDAPEGAYPDGLDGILGVASLGLKRIQLDFQRGIFSWEP